jgi:hypothetical protein
LYLVATYLSNVASLSIHDLTTVFRSTLQHDAELHHHTVVFGTSVLNLTASLVQNYTGAFNPQTQSNSIAARNIDFCNVTVTYTHEGQNDTINVETWLPSTNGMDDCKP